MFFIFLLRYKWKIYLQSTEEEEGDFSWKAVTVEEHRIIPKKIIHRSL